MFRIRAKGLKRFLECLLDPFFTFGLNVFPRGLIVHHTSTMNKEAAGTFEVHLIIEESNFGNNGSVHMDPVNGVCLLEVEGESRSDLEEDE